MELPIGYDNFGQIMALGLTFVDKSLLIKDFIDDKKTQVALVTRPRRFGKSLNLSMLHHFFAAKVTGIATKGLFDHLTIATLGDDYMRHQGQYPVIALSFKDIKASKFKSAYANLCSVLNRAFHDHIEILDHPSMTAVQKKNFTAIFNAKPKESIVSNAILNLSNYLFQCYNQKVILLIDEYDAPIHAGYINGYYDEMIELMRHLFSAALKSNPYLYRAMLTGILRVSKESLFSGLNNIDVYSVLRSEYCEYFGFTETEVAELLRKSDLNISLAEVRAWYNGYQIGHQTLYNPWSLVNCIKRDGGLQPYWIGTSGNELLKTSLAQATSEIKINIETLLQKKPIEQLIDESFVFTDLAKDESALWSLLLASGYLKAVTAIPKGTKINCNLLIPNQEIMYLYEDMFKEWFSDKMGQGGYHSFLKNLLNGNVTDFTSMLEDFLLSSASFFDVGGHHPEKFYHGLVLGLMASLQETHFIKSNQESGYGRYDVMIIPRDTSQLGIIMEFKTAKKGDQMMEVAQSALQQINAKNYEVTLRQAGITSILKLGLAFKGKNVVIAK